MSEEFQEVPDAAVRVREGWLVGVTAHFQRALSEAERTAGATSATVTAVGGVPIPGNRLEELVLGGLLLEMAIGSRATTAVQILARAERLKSLTPRRAALSLAERAAIHIQDGHHRPLDISRLAKSLGCDETGVRRRFKAEYLLCPREYHSRVRVQVAVRMLGSTSLKVAAIAASVGYASEKNFFRAVRRFTTQTPGEVRALRPTELRQLADSLVPCARSRVRSV